MLTRDMVPYVPIPVNGFAFADINHVMWLWDPQTYRVFCIEAQVEMLIDVECPHQNGFDAYTMIEALLKVKEAQGSD